MNTIKKLCKHYADQNQNNRLYREWIEECYSIHSKMEEAIEFYPISYFKELLKNGVVGISPVFHPKGCSKKGEAGYRLKEIHSHIEGHDYLRIDDINNITKVKIQKKNIENCENRIKSKLR